MPSERVLVVEDEDALRWVLCEKLTSAGFATEDAATGSQALRIFQERSRFDAVLLDYKLPDACGLDLLRQMKQASPTTPVVVMTSCQSVEVAVRAMKLGASDFALKPLDVDALSHVLRSALSTLEPTSDPMNTPPGTDGATPVLVGASEGMRRVRAKIERVAPSPVSTILLTGESGTGKDVVARTIHAASPRARRPFVNITCSALPENLLESELFGHEAGSFTSATRQKKGLFELADGGTVFLDEIGEMTPALQAKLLRFIEERAFRRVGGTRDMKVDVRVVAATNRDLLAEVSSGRFREDLYYRLRVVPIHLPPLRERTGDIEPLIEHFIGEFGRLFGRRIAGLERSAFERLLEHAWPGNVRELKHVIEQAVLMTDGPLLSVPDFGLGHRPRRSSRFRLPPEGLVLEELERSLLVQALDLSQWNHAQAGKLLGLNRDQVRYRIEKFALTPGVSDGFAA